MVCDSCEKKLGTLACQDKWKEGSRTTIESGMRKVGENKLLSKQSVAQQRFSPYENKCKICKQKVHQMHSVYCQACAYKKGICSMCGKQILDVKNLKQSMA